MSRKIFKTQEIKIAVLAIVSLALIVWGINFLKGKNIFKKQFTYYGIFEETSGLMPANTVYINGVNVGIVDKIALFGSQNEKVIVTFTVNKKVKIPKNSQIRIVSPGIVGSMQLECVLGDASTYFTNGDTLHGYVQPGMLANVDVIKNNLDTIIRSLKNIIQDGSLQASLQNINSTTDKLDSIMYSGQIENILADIKNFTNTIKSNDSELDSIIKNVNQFSGTLKDADIPKTLEDLSGRLKQLENILTKIEKGEGTLGKLNTNDTLYQNLQHSIGNLDELIKDIKANPKRYLNVTVFGGKKK